MTKSQFKICYILGFFFSCNCWRGVCVIVSSSPGSFNKISKLFKINDGLQAFYCFQHHRIMRVAVSLNDNSPAGPCGFDLVLIWANHWVQVAALQWFSGPNLDWRPWTSLVCGRCGVGQLWVKSNTEWVIIGDCMADLRQSDSSPVNSVYQMQSWGKRCCRCWWLQGHKSWFRLQTFHPICCTAYLDCSGNS